MAVKHALLLVFGHQHGDHALRVVQHHAAHAARIAAHRAHVVFVKAHGLAAVGEQHHVVLAVGQRGANQEVAFVQVDGDDAGLARVVEFVQRRLLDRAHAGGHEDVLVRREAAFSPVSGSTTVIFSPSCKREHVDDGAAARAARACGTSQTLSQYSRPRLEKHRM